MHRDHPRTCGEKPGNVSGAHNVAGSPPHMRGKVSFTVVPPSVCGITPRTCGEKAYKSVMAGSLWGSPPHMRGKGCFKRQCAGFSGITPAHAGKSAAGPPMPFPCRDHPRTCGEKKSATSRPQKKWGSPPHMRGKAGSLAACCVALGITPAHAGKRSKSPTNSVGLQDHPRTCGEKP